MRCESVKLAKYQMIPYMTHTYFRQPREALTFNLHFNTFKFETTWDKVTCKMQSFKLSLRSFYSYSYM